MAVSSWSCTYDLNTTLQWFLKYIWSPLNINIGDYFSDIPFPGGSVFNHVIKNYIILMVIWSGKQEYCNVFMIPPLRYLTIVIVLYTYPKFYNSTAMLDSAFTNLSVTSLIYLFISIINIIKPPLQIDLSLYLIFY